MSLSTILRGRGKRREYWLGFVVLLALLVVGRLLPHPAARLLANLAGVALWIVLAARRLRDIGWPAWLSLAPIALMILTIALAQLTVAANNGISQIVGALLMASGWIWVIFVIAIGLWKAKRRPAGQDKAEVFA